MPQLDDAVKNVTVFSRLMNSGETTTQNLAKYIYYASKLRKEKLNELALARNIISNWYMYLHTNVIYLN